MNFLNVPKKSMSRVMSQVLKRTFGTSSCISSCSPSFFLPIFTLALFLFSACQSKPNYSEPIRWSDSALPPAQAPTGQMLIGKKDVWSFSHPRINAFTQHYKKNAEAKAQWKNAQPYLRYIMNEFEAWGLPKELCLLPMIESGFKVDAKSKTGATGLWQFTEQTGRWMGLVINRGVDERLDWRKSTSAAARYLHYLARRYNGDWALVLAAYNLGPTALDKEMQVQHTRNFWQLKLKAETQDYVPRFLALIQELKPDSKS